jgi:hypothetical protein
VLKNLMRAAYEREQQGQPLPEPGKAPAPTPPQPAAAQKEPAPKKAKDRESPPARQEKLGSSSASSQLEKLASLRDQGILTAEEFEKAKSRLMVELR